VVSAGLTISAGLADKLLEHARGEAPNEACGLLSGDLAARTATAYHPARNANASPYVYSVHPDDLVRIVLGIEDAGQDLVAIFHSHPNTPAIPSPTDIRSALYPDAFYLLASLSAPDARPAESLRTWRIRDGNGTEVPLKIR
jgi:proteasome lid subunit RPN8/RPN11